MVYSSFRSLISRGHCTRWINLLQLQHNLHPRILVFLSNKPLCKLLKLFTLLMFKSSTQTKKNMLTSFTISINGYSLKFYLFSEPILTTSILQAPELFEIFPCTSTEIRPFFDLHNSGMYYTLPGIVIINVCNLVSHLLESNLHKTKYLVHLAHDHLSRSISSFCNVEI